MSRAYQTNSNYKVAVGDRASECMKMLLQPQSPKLRKEFENIKLSKVHRRLNALRQSRKLLSKEL